MTENDGPGAPPERPGETTSVFRPDMFAEIDAEQSEQPVAGVDALPAGSALLVVKRGPNAGSRFLLDREITSAGRHPESDIFLDATPLTVLAIGDPPTMAAALNIPGGVVDTVERAGGEVQITQRDRVDITALRTLRTPQYARPAG